MTTFFSNPSLPTQLPHAGQACIRQEREYSKGWKDRIAGYRFAPTDWPSKFHRMGWTDADAAIARGRIQEGPHGE